MINEKSVGGFNLLWSIKVGMCMLASARSHQHLWAKIHRDFLPIAGCGSVLITFPQKLIKLLLV